MQQHTQSEQWRSALGFEGYYEISDHGQVRSVARTASNGSPVRTRMKKQVIDEHGRPRVYLHVDGKKHTRRVARLVLEAFVGPCPQGMEACHWDDDATNNHLSNLRWDSRSANQIDRLRNGRNYNANKTHCPNGHPLEQPNLVRSLLPVRLCKACNRAHASIQRHPERDHRTEADRYYRVILME